MHVLIAPDQFMDFALNDLMEDERLIPNLRAAIGSVVDFIVVFSW